MPDWLPRVHNRFRDLDERWKSASTGRRNRLPHLLCQPIDPARWGRRFRLPFQWPHGMTIHKIAELRNCQPIDEVSGLLLEERGAVNLARAAGDVLPRKRSGWLCRKRLIR